MKAQTSHHLTFAALTSGLNISSSSAFSWVIAPNSCFYAPEYLLENPLSRDFCIANWWKVCLLGVASPGFVVCFLDLSARAKLASNISPISSLFGTWLLWWTSELLASTYCTKMLWALLEAYASGVIRAKSDGFGCRFRSSPEIPSSSASRAASSGSISFSFVPSASRKRAFGSWNYIILEELFKNYNYLLV